MNVFMLLAGISTLTLTLLLQLVWATSSRIGCAINVCYNMNVWGMIWAKAVYLVCNYSPPYVLLQLSVPVTQL